jgi:hypothetical protein
LDSSQFSGYDRKQGVLEQPDRGARQPAYGECFPGEVVKQIYTLPSQAPSVGVEDQKAGTPPTATPTTR